ncbi:DUF1801 domain-containing protein [Aquimarina sp. MMG016]|uniref:DUF1801 domain-containing protein n=1 Tax=Aquimarina sp. MMG016 TaxID=2822690 RepID=UPI001B3A7585|nr:DUF1801 domain-containing protein [Aquimarina sp. MMG016]MBQ4820293.1 DUF1801 domain-containing protein [Aquimarina sp. MMG016]
MDIEEYLNDIKNDQRKQDCQTLLDLMKKVSKEEPRIWRNSIVGFGSYHYRYESGTEGDWLLTGFSSRSQNISIYIMAGFDRYEEFLSKLGKHKIGKSCLYVKQLSDIDMNVLESMINDSYHYAADKYQ